jgi:hypothetical protein
LETFAASQWFQEPWHPVRAPRGRFPVSFHRSGSSRNVEFLVCIIATPLVAIFTAIFAVTPVALAATALGVPFERAWSECFLLFLVMTLVYAVGMCVWGYNDYCSKAELEVTVERDGVTVRRNSRERLLLFEDVVAITLFPSGSELGCELIPRSGRALRLPPEIAPFFRIRNELGMTVIFQLLGRMDERLTRGETVEVRISTVRVTATMLRASGTWLLGATMLLNPLCFSLGRHFLRQGRLLLQQSLMGIRGGVALEDGGLCSPTRATRPVMPWDAVELVRVDSAGLTMRTDDGHWFAISAISNNYLPAMRLIKSRIRDRNGDIALA